MKNDKEKFSFISTIFSSIKDLLTNGIVEHVKESTEKIADKVQEELDYMLKHFLQQLIAVSLIITALVFLSIGLVRGFQQIFFVTPTISYMASGLIVLILALWYQHISTMRFRLEQYKRREKIQ